MDNYIFPESGKQESIEIVKVEEPTTNVAVQMLNMMTKQQRDIEIIKQKLTEKEQ